MGRLFVIVLAATATAAAAAAPIVGGAGDSSVKTSTAKAAMTEERNGPRCAAPCLRLHRGDRMIGPCQPSVRYSYGQGVSGGLISADFKISERSRRGCMIVGYPTISMIDSNGRQLPTHVVQRTEYPARLIRVRRSHPIYFNIVYHWSTVNAQAYCRPSPHALRLRLPGATQTLTVPVDGPGDQLRVFTPCGGELWVLPL